MDFHGKLIVNRLQRLQRQLEAMPTADAKPTAGRSAASCGATWLKQMITREGVRGFYRCGEEVVSSSPRGRWPNVFYKRMR